MAMSNFKAEIVSLRDCLKDRHFIPDMQRQYEWATNSGGKHVPKLWESLLEFDSNDPDHEDEYYTGTLICYKEGGKWGVIDGQQRLTTLSVLFIAIRDSIADEFFLHEGKQFTINGESKTIKEIVGIISKETLGNNRHPRLTPKDLDTPGSARNSKSFVWHLRKKPRPETDFGIHRPTCNFKINQAYGMFIREIKDKFDLTSNAGMMAIIRFYEHVLTGVVFNRTVVNDMAQGYRIFSTENTTGLNLNHMDITRALMLGQIDRRKLSASTNTVVQKLAQMSRTLDSSSPAVKNNFIRIVWVIRNGTPMNKTKLLNSINSDVKELTTDEMIKSFSNDLSVMATCFSKKILSPSTSDYHYRQHKDLMNCGFKQHYPLTLALLLRENSSNEENEVREILGIIESVYVRYILVGGLRPNTFENMFAAWSKKATEVDNLQKLIAKIKSDIGDVAEPEMFKKRFSELSPQTKVATYILSKIERHENEKVDEISDFASARAVPIIPNSYYSSLSEAWQSMCSSEIYASGIASKIGNMFLIQEERVRMWPTSEDPNEQNEKLLENAGKMHHSKSTIEDLDGVFYSTSIKSRGTALSETADQVWKIF